MNKKDKNNNEIFACTCLLLSIAKSDENIEHSEINIIKDIIVDFFDYDISNIDTIIKDAVVDLNESTDLFKYSKILNESFTYQDKVDFICCTFEVAFSDGEFHYLEESFIKKIATTLNVEHSDLIKSKQEMKKYFD